MALPAVITKSGFLSSEAADSPFIFKRQEMVRDNEIYVKSEYRWGDVESFEEETEIWVKAWNDLEMELEYERVVKTPDHVSMLKWKVEILLEAVVFLFVDADGDGLFEMGDSQVSMRKLIFNDIQWIIDPENEKNTFVVTDENEFLEATITIFGGLTEPDGTMDNEPEGHFTFGLISLCSEESTHMAIKVKANFQYPDLDSQMVGYLVSDCSEGITENWSFPDV
ncbi:MAG: hypothetical protein ACE5HJ_02245 [Thermoplasmata archaeon]